MNACWKVFGISIRILILIGGDMLVRKDGNSYDKTVHFLAKLPESARFIVQMVIMNRN